MRKMSEILASALERFGPNGERWMKGAYTNKSYGTGTHKATMQAIDDGEKMCAYGSIIQDMRAHEEPTMDDVTNYAQWLHFIRPFEKLMGSQKCVVSRNDDAKEFGEVKAMFCTGIKKALDEENNDAQSE